MPQALPSSTDVMLFQSVRVGIQSSLVQQWPSMHKVLTSNLQEDNTNHLLLGNYSHLSTIGSSIWISIIWVRVIWIREPMCFPNVIKAVLLLSLSHLPNASHCNPAWPWTAPILLCKLSEFWNYKHVPQCLRCNFTTILLNLKLMKLKCL